MRPDNLTEKRSLNLAGKGARLGAFVIDRLCFATFAGLTIWAAFVTMPGFEKSFPNRLDKEGWDPTWFLTFSGVILFSLLPLAIVQMVLLTRYGQTIGKRLLKIRIVRVSDGQNGGFVTNVLMREVLGRFAAIIPYVGFVYSLVDFCTIFGDERHCLHDMIAGTNVIRVVPLPRAQSNKS